MDVQYHFCGRRVPHRVVERALELFDQEVGLDPAIAEAKQETQQRQQDALHEVSELYRAAQESRRMPEPYQPTATDELFIERRAHGLLLVIARVTQYLPEDRDLIHELMERASRDKWGE